MSTYVVWHDHAITKLERHQLNGHKSCIIWFTGLSGSGKSTLASALEQELYKRSLRSYVLDGDNIRHGLCQDLGFSNEDRIENIRRISEVAKLFVDSGIIVLTAFISPFEADRQLARSRVAPEEFIEVYVKCPLDVCEQRDIKGLYKKARSGEIRNFTGIDSPYEEPASAELVIDTSQHSIEACVQQILSYLEQKGVIS